MMSPSFFFSFFFFWQLWRLRFPLPQLLPNGSVACVMATCHSRVGWRVLGSSETFQFSHVFWGASFLNPLCSLSALTFAKFQSSCVHCSESSASSMLLRLWFLCSSPRFLNFTFFFRYTPLFFLFFLSFWSFICFLFLCLVPFLNFSFFVSFFMDYSNIRCISPLVIFFFTRLGVFIGCSSGYYPQIGDFALGDSSLSLALGDLYLLLCQSLSWFESVQGVLRRESMSSKVRSSDLEANLPSSTSMGGVEMDTAISMHLPSRPSTSPRSFYALQEECSLREVTFLRFKDRFQFPEETRVHLSRRGKKSCAFAH